MRHLKILGVILLVALGFGQEYDDPIQDIHEYMFTLAPREDVLQRFFNELESRGFQADTTRFTPLLEDGSLVDLSKEPDGIVSYLDLNQPNEYVGSLFPLYMLNPSNPRANVELAPCSGLLVFVKDLNSLPQDDAILILQQIRDILELEFGAGVAYGPNPDGSGGGGSTNVTFKTQPTNFNHKNYYAVQAVNPSNVTIAIIDTGVGGTNDPFQSSLEIQEGYNFVQGNKDASDDYIYESVNPPGIPLRQHGSPVAYISSKTTESMSVPKPQIMPVKVCDNNGSPNLDDDCKVSNIIMGICYALLNYNPENVLNKRLVINLSLGGETPVDLLGQVIWQSMDEHAVVVASGGNDRNNLDDYNESYYPGAFECRPSDKIKITIPSTMMVRKVCPPSPSSSPTYDTNGLISVSSVNDDGIRSLFSVRTLYNDVAALGEYSTTPLENRQGTSFAAPVVSGIVAAILTQHPKATPQEIETCIRTVASATSPLNVFLGIGSGIIKPANMVDKLGSCTFTTN
jgi:subtilisin family serine protease